MDNYSKSYGSSIGRTSLFEVGSTPPPAAHSGASILKRPLNSNPSLPNDHHPQQQLQPVHHHESNKSANKRNKSNHQQHSSFSASSSKQQSSSSSTSSSSVLTPASLIAASMMGLDSIQKNHLLGHHHRYTSSQQPLDASRFSHLASPSPELPTKLIKYDDQSSSKGKSQLINLSSKSQIESPRVTSAQPTMDESEKDVPLNLSVKRSMDDCSSGTGENLSRKSSTVNCDNLSSHQRKKAKRQQQHHHHQQQQLHLQQQQLIQLQQQQQKQLQQHQQQLQIQHLRQQQQHSQQSKSLLSNPTEIITIPNISHDGKPRKRGRPPILSPPPPEPSRSTSDGGPSIPASLAASLANSSGLHPAAAASLLASAQGALSPLEIYKTILAQNCFQSMFSPGSFLFPGHLNGDPLGALNRANSLNSLNNQTTKSSSSSHQGNSNNGNSSNSKVIVCEPVEDKKKRDTSRGGGNEPFEGDSDLAGDDDIDYETPKVFDEEELRKPMKFGWRRQTLIQCITKSGIRGEVIYYSPSAKKMRNITEVCRYLLKKNISTVSKENFSFDSRPIIGEFIEHSKERGTSFNLLSENEVRVRLEDIKRQIQLSGLEGDVDEPISDVDTKNVESASSRSFKRDTPFYNDQKPKEHQTRVTIEEVEALRDDMFKRYQESKESSERRYQTSMFPESDFYKKKDLEMVAEIERERRKQHMMLVRAMDNHKKFEERERRSRIEIAEKRAIMEKKFQKRKAEIEIQKELKRSVEDMVLKNSKALPTLNRIPGLKLPSKVFSDCLFFFEFLHNFGETLGFDMESLPSLNNLQKALLNLDDSAEKEMVSTLHQLLVCAIDDPGIPCNISTVMGQKLKDAPITDFNLSEILKLYFQSFSNAHSDSSDEEYLPTTIYEVLKTGKPFLSLNAAQKMDILSFICNELTNNQAVVKQIESTVENLIILRREKWVLGCELRKYKAIKLRREKATSEEAGEALKKFDKTEIDAGLLDDSGDSDADDNIIITVHETDEEATITNEELDKKLDKLAKQCSQMNVKLTNAMQCMRVVPLGQDRYRRRFWVLSASGGIFVEGLESGHRDNLYMEDSDDEEEDESSETEEENEDGENEDKIKQEEDIDIQKEESKAEPMEIVESDVKPQVKEEKRGKKKVKKNKDNIDKETGLDSTIKEETTIDVEMKEESIAKDDEEKEKDENSEKDTIEVVEVKEVKKEKSGLVKLEKLGGKHSLSPEVTIELKGMVPEEKPSNRETTVTIQPVSAPLKSLPKGEIKCDMEIAGVNTIKHLGHNSDGTWISPVTDGFPRSSLFDSKMGPSSSRDFNSRNGFLDASGFPFESVSPERSWFNVVPRVPCNDTTITICPVPTVPAPTTTPPSTSSTSDPQSSKTTESVEESDNKPLNSSENSPSPTTKPSQNVFMETFVYPHLSGSLFSQNSTTNATNGAKSEANSSHNDLSHQHPSSSLTNGDIDMSIVNPALLMGPEFEIDPELLKKLEQHKKQQHRKPKRIPEEFQRGWWIIDDVGQIRSILESLNEKGFREKHLKKQLTKYLTYVSTNYKAAITEFDICDLDRKVSQESPFGVPEPIEDDYWCKEVALRLDIAVLEQIEALEEKIASSSMQIRGWRPTTKLSTDSNVKFELSILYEIIEKDDESGDENNVRQKSSTKGDDPPPPKETKGKKKILDPIKAGRERLLATEAGIERRYLKPPLGFKSNTILVTSPNSNGDEYADNAADENAPTGLVRWREAVRECRSGSQLALLLHFLESCIAWDKSIMRASCQFCSGGENEAQLLLCDGCDKGYHMYCFKPKMETVPDGDWFCYECQNKNTIDKVCIICGKKGKLINCDTCPKVFHPNCLDPPVTKPPKGRWCCNICNRKPKKIVKGRKTMTSLNAGATLTIDETPVKKETPSNSKSTSSTTPTATTTPKEDKSSKKSKTTKKPKKEAKTTANTPTATNESTKTPTTPSTTPAPKETKKEKKAKQKSEESKEMVICENLLKDLTAHEDCWPFLFPVNTKQFPTYKKIIKKPMDFETIKGNLKAGGYKNKSEFITDCRLVFDNCETFNEDESPVGIAGHNMRRFMEKRWKELGGEN